MMFTNYLKRIFINLFTKEYSNSKLFLQLLFPIQFLSKKKKIRTSICKVISKSKFYFYFIYKKNHFLELYLPKIVSN